MSDDYLLGYQATGIIHRWGGEVLPSQLGSLLYVYEFRHRSALVLMPKRREQDRIAFLQPCSVV